MAQRDDPALRAYKARLAAIRQREAGEQEAGTPAGGYHQGWNLVQQARLEVWFRVFDSGIVAHLISSDDDLWHWAVRLPPGFPAVPTGLEFHCKTFAMAKWRAEERVLRLHAEAVDALERQAGTQKSTGMHLALVQSE